jgi:uncharacterized membrane protein YedE/YeeE
MPGEIPRFFIVFGYLFAAAIVFVVACFVIPVTIIRLYVRWKNKEIT